MNTLKCCLMIQTFPDDSNKTDSEHFLTQSEAELCLNVLSLIVWLIFALTCLSLDCFCLKTTQTKWNQRLKKSFANVLFEKLLLRVFNVKTKTIQMFCFSLKYSAFTNLFSPPLSSHRPPTDKLSAGVRTTSTKTWTHSETQNQFHPNGSDENSLCLVYEYRRR